MGKKSYEEVIDTRKEHDVKKQVKKETKKYKRRSRRKSRLLLCLIALFAIMMLIGGKGFGLGNGLGLGMGNGQGNGTTKTNNEDASYAKSKDSSNEKSEESISEQDYGKNTIVITVKDYNIYYNGNKVENIDKLEEKILSVDFEAEEKEVIVKDKQARMTAYNDVKDLLSKLNIAYNEQ